MSIYLPGYCTFYFANYFSGLVHAWQKLPNAINHHKYDENNITWPTPSLPPNPLNGSTCLYQQLLNHDMFRIYLAYLRPLSNVGPHPYTWYLENRKNFGPHPHTSRVPYLSDVTSARFFYYFLNFVSLLPPRGGAGGRATLSSVAKLSTNQWELRHQPGRWRHTRCTYVSLNNTLLFRSPFNFFLVN